ncbi:MarR family winged helix-turn-helix transcriptional regulator [Cryptosporangium sp. NPDC051539]|uniref:MarR family winged helix-turn-helix transcriptional regulator n=1 Tax=Cryptosporangium sp. NPDC051539 TaxID=3363962 RepID=UPI0037B4E1ED
MTRSLAEVGLSVKRLQMHHHRSANAALAPLDISIVQWDALRHLSQNPDASLHDLAQLTFQTDQSFGTLAGRLLDRGLIERVPGPGRAVRHRLTPHGEQVREAGQALLNEVLERTFRVLGPSELEIFDGFLLRLLNGTGA